MVRLDHLPQLLTGETVTVLTPTVSYDAHGDRSVAWADTEVGNVLVAPSSTADVEDTTRPDGTRASFTLGFPKTFTASLRGCHVIVRGVECAVVGDPQPYTAANVPGAWNYTAEVERVNG
ncbi:hypothetical protein B5G20_04950 [Collinsella sp. An7]|uniref:hypothetical protein n=1 Tax=Collinsella sp. An7 TaxID=1965651 RepID=UPI000B3AE64D|nr:hypothetical protein [Collinsella sp. An7]OUN47316.1 hypothetical protein B5G20_04950 [Collinsella sp. An7]